MVPVADEGRRLRRLGLPRHRAGLRHPRRSGGAGRRGAPAWGCGCSSTWCPTTPPTSTRGSRQRWRPPEGSPERARFVFREGRGAGGDLPPNDWQSQFGGPAWTRLTDRDGHPGQWYLHLFAPEQPDLDWSNPEVRADFEATLRFWFDRGVDGFRIDVAHGLIKAELLPDVGELVWPSRPPAPSTRGSIRTGTGRPCTTSIAPGARSPTPTPTAGCSSPRPGCSRLSGSRSTCDPTSSTPRSTSSTS